jgi:hypothetical protein
VEKSDKESVEGFVDFYLFKAIFFFQVIFAKFQLVF